MALLAAIAKRAVSAEDKNFYCWAQLKNHTHISKCLDSLMPVLLL